MAILPDLSHEAMAVEIAKLRAENAALIQSKGGSLTLKVTEKGGLAIYGLGRFPVTLYVGQWERLLAFVETGAIKAFIAAQGSKLSRKEITKS